MCKENTLERFTGTPEGRACLMDIQNALRGRTIVDVSFCSRTDHIDVILHFENDETIIVAQPFLEIEAICEQYGALRV